MKQARFFVTAMALTVCLGHAGIGRVATADGSSERPVAPSSGKVLIDGGELAGELIHHRGLVFAVFTATNNGGQPMDVDFEYAAYHTAASHPFSRMLSSPTEIKRARCTFTVASGTTIKKTIPLEGAPAPAAAPDAGAQPLEMGVPMGEPVWSLVVARDSLGANAGWGATIPSPLTNVRLEDQQLVLATSVLLPVADANQDALGDMQMVQASY